MIVLDALLNKNIDKSIFKDNPLIKVVESELNVTISLNDKIENKLYLLISSENKRNAQLAARIISPYIENKSGYCLFWKE